MIARKSERPNKVGEMVREKLNNKDKSKDQS